MNRTKKTITGFHVTLMFVAFFGVIMAVNFLMAGLALGSFSGTVVDNSYVASQKYNQWLEESRKEAAHGWTVNEPVRVSDRLQMSVTGSSDTALSDATITAIAEHPVGRTEALSLTFEEKMPGQYTSNEALPAGRWKLKISISEGGRSFDLVGEVM
ncbi:FixH family protein [Parasphingorhabdus halotolerans]|uniref:FixH family protein n=1 Tax=Parasphingorhabdus halotolerans TaxID=2725558 RepID=A0A6H2DS59_9SPHN|nr:FixH family protein [Parasphingorhabdus halotolerans]QJB70496.1 FixH family protein [Parasphingorhabdus halotolerans]